MKKILCFGIAAVVACSPFLATAQTLPVGPTLAQLTTRVAALEAQEAASPGQSLVCVALFSAPSVKVGQEVALAWGSVGAVEQTKDTSNMWSLDGGSTLLFSKSGSWIYSFTFYGANGSSTNCSATIVAI